MLACLAELLPILIKGIHSEEGERNYNWFPSLAVTLAAAGGIGTALARMLDSYVKQKLADIVDLYMRKLVLFAKRKGIGIDVGSNVESMNARKMWSFEEMEGRYSDQLSNIQIEEPLLPLEEPKKGEERNIDNMARMEERSVYDVITIRFCLNFLGYSWITSWNPFDD